MSKKPHLLTLPMEMRCHIYSYIYLEDRIVDFLRPKPHYTKTALFLSCQQLYQETLEYYFSKNTFSLPLCQRFAMSNWRFIPRHFNLVKVLLLEANTFFWISSNNSAKSSKHTKNCKRRLSNYLEALFWVDKGMQAPNLKALTFADRMPTINDPWYWGESTEKSKEILNLYLQVFEKLHIGVGQVAVVMNREDSREAEN